MVIKFWKKLLLTVALTVVWWFTVLFCIWNEKISNENLKILKIIQWIKIDHKLEIAYMTYMQSI